MADENWVEFRADIHDHPILVENRRGFQALQALRFHPRVIVAIGDRSKRQFFQDSQYQQRFTPLHTPGIHIRPWLKSQVLMDCELHTLSRLAAIKALPLSGSRKQRSLQSLVQPPGSHLELFKLAFNFYWQVLIPFASTVFLFLDDLDDHDLVIELLANWVRKSVANPVSSPSRLLCLYQKHTAKNARFLTSLRLRLAALLPKCNVAQMPSGCDLTVACETAFESVQVIPTAVMPLETVELVVEEAFSIRERDGFAFSVQHLQSLLETAADQFCEGYGQQINFYHATRLNNPGYKALSSHVSHFMELACGSDIDRVEIVASSLDLDAHPPRMHCFRPDLEFDQLYLRPIAKLLNDTESGCTTNQIRRRFITLTQERRDSSSAHAHLRLLLRFRASWMTLHSSTTCLICLNSSPTTHLTCGHTLCDPCTVICATASACEDRNIAIESCPFCGAVNQRIITMRPKTAGLRILDLDGPPTCKLAMWQFLRDIQYYTGLPMSIREHFDLAFGSNIGSFFIFTIFANHWDLNDCKYHLKNVAEPSIRNKSVVCFGKNLDWDTDDVKTTNGGPICLKFKQETLCSQSFKLFEFPKEEMARSADLCTRFSGQTVDMQSMRATASRLIAALFYIELCSAPQFHVGNEHASVRVRCRLPPGKQLLLLLKHLNRKATNVHYRGDETRFLSEPLVDSRSLHECRDGRQFSKHLRMRVNTFQSFLHIKIDGIAGGEETISNCPYELQKIITDQGLHLHFGSKDHKLTNEPLEISPNRWDETARLHDTLDEVVLSYSQLAMVPHDSSVVRPLNSLI